MWELRDRMGTPGQSRAHEPWGIRALGALLLSLVLIVGLAQFGSGLTGSQNSASSSWAWELSESSLSDSSVHHTQDVSLQAGFRAEAKSWNWKGLCYVDDRNDEGIPEGKSFPLCDAAKVNSHAPLRTMNPITTTPRPIVTTEAPQPPTTPMPAEPGRAYCHGQVDFSTPSGKIVAVQQPGTSFDCRWRINSKGAATVNLSFEELNIFGAQTHLLIFIGEEDAQEMEYESAINVARAYVNLNDMRSRPQTIECPSDTVLIIFKGDGSNQATKNFFRLTWETSFAAPVPPRPASEPSDTIVRLCQSSHFDPSTCVEVDACDRRCGHDSCHNLDGQCFNHGGKCVLKGSAMFMSCQTCLMAYAQVPKGVYVKYYDLSGVWPDENHSCSKMKRGVTYKGERHGPTQGLVHLGSGSHCSVYIGIEDSGLCPDE